MLQCLGFEVKCVSGAEEGRACGRRYIPQFIVGHVVMLFSRYQLQCRKYGAILVISTTKMVEEIVNGFANDYIPVHRKPKKTCGKSSKVE
jgi:hypothetical protein